MYKSLLSLVNLSVIAVCLTGCNILPIHPSVNSGTAQAVTALTAVVNTSNKAVQDQLTQLTNSLTALSTARLNTDQFISDRLAESLYFNLNNPQPNAVTLQITNNLTAAASALGVPPSAAVKDQEIADLKLALSSSASDAKVLAARNQDLANQAAALKGQTDLLTKQVTDKETALSTAAQILDVKTNALSQANDQVQIQAKETAVAQAQAQKEAAEKLRLETARWFLFAGGILFALGIVGLVIHIPDSWLASVAGASLIVVGWGITYVEDLLQQAWFRYLLDGVVVFGILSGAWFVFRALGHKKAVTTTEAGFEALVGAVQSAAAKNPAIETQLQPILQEWLVTDKGVPDQNVINQINQMAVKLNLINPGQSSVAATASTIVASPVATVPATPAAATVSTAPASTK